MSELYLGNEAVARGLWEAGASVISSYPGTPSTEITEYAATYKDMYSEWAPNEKVAVEVSIGASIAGVRAFSAMKHVGLNVAADPLYTASYTGVNGGLVIAVADDPGMHSSQNEQDSRGHAKTSKVPMLEPSDSQECLDFTKEAFRLSEEYDTPVLLRLSTRVSHSRSLCETGSREKPPRREYKRDVQKYVMMPAMARGRHVVVEQRTEQLRLLAETSPLNKVELHDRRIGVISSGAAYQYAKEALGERASYLKLGMAYPLPVELIKDFAAKVDTLYVVEELDPFIEEHCKAHGIKVVGKKLFPLCGELSQRIVREKLLGEEPETMQVPQELPGRPPVMCAGCPHRGLFYALKKTGAYVSGDIGCYTLGAGAPLAGLDSTVCMGASVSGAHGFYKACGGDRPVVAVIGDSTFVHSGITGLIGVAYNKSSTLTVILDNSITGMTGHQQNPATGITLSGEATASVDLEALCKAVGIVRVRVCDPYDLPGTIAAVEEEIAAEGASVLISRRPCALLKSVKHRPALRVDAAKCTGCKACLQIGCPAVRYHGKKAAINRDQCVGCGQCVSLCRFGAIGGEE